MVRGRLQLDRRGLSATRRALAAIEGVSISSRDDLIADVTVAVRTPRALGELRASPFVDYVEPASMRPLLASDGWSGCSGNVGDTNSAGGDIWTGPVKTLDSQGVVVDPAPGVVGDLVPTNYLDARIPAAWSRGATGAGVTVGILGTGIFSEQGELRMPPYGTFNSGWSAGRSILYEDVSTELFPWDWNTHKAWDTCNHGTRVAGTVAAPRDSHGLVGVAWRANVVAEKVGPDVFINAWQTEAFINGLRNAVFHGAKIINTSLGTGSWQYDSMKNEILRQYYDNGILFVSAADTTYCWEGYRLSGKPA